MVRLCSVANTICEKEKKGQISLKASLRNTHFEGSSCWKKRSDTLCEKEEPVVGQTQECTAGQDHFQQMVQFSESDHLLLQIDVCAQVITLKGKYLELSTLLRDIVEEYQ